MGQYSQQNGLDTFNYHVSLCIDQPILLIVLAPSSSGSLAFTVAMLKSKLQFLAHNEAEVGTPCNFFAPFVEHVQPMARRYGEEGDDDATAAVRIRERG